MRVSAALQVPPGPDRFAVITQDYTIFHWWLVSWQDDQIACSISVIHEGLPWNSEIAVVCGETIHAKWLATPLCDTAVEDSASCKGYYLLFNKSELAHKQQGVSLPPPVVWVTLNGCVSYNSTFRCDTLPSLILIGEEPLAGEHITSLVGRIDGKPFVCNPTCHVDLAPTGNNGILLEFWAESSYGDTSGLFSARVRVASSENPTDSSWYVDILSSQWRGTPLAACSQIWNVYPPVGGVPFWLSTPNQATQLATDFPYDYLAANLINHGIVDASACVYAGLHRVDAASPCGIEKARQAVTEWQNRFDDLILSSALETGIPAQLLKRILAQESQFWPGASIDHPEAGLGQMTVGGADTTFLWNAPFFEQFCPATLDPDICSRGYGKLSSSFQVMLQNALVNRVNATCNDCSNGIDLDRANQSIPIFAETLLANCAQAGMVVELNDRNKGKTPVSYEDLWRFTLVNYNAGAGCLGLALDKTGAKGEPLDWEHVSSHFTPVCQGTVDYVNDIVAGLP